MRYSVPLIFFQAGWLYRFYTDLLATQGWPRFLSVVPKPFQPAGLRRLTSRGVEIADFPRNKIVTFPALGVRYALRRMSARNALEMTRAHYDVADAMSSRIVRKGIGPASHLYCFDTASLGVMRHAAKAGLRIVMEQTNAPRPVMQDLMKAEQARHPGWDLEEVDAGLGEMIQARYREAWELADCVVCGSSFVREGMRRCGGPAEKCAIVPYGVDLGEISEMASAPWLQARRARRYAGKPLRVLSVGSVSLRKGAPYILEAARRLGPAAQFRLAGALDITGQARDKLAQSVELTGLVPRNEIVDHYRWADVFLLPSICEGSATVCYEALKYGLPVICTPNTGSVVRDGVDGLIVAPSSGEAIVEAIQRILDAPALWETLSGHASMTAQTLDVKHYGQRLLKAVEFLS